MSAQSTSRRSPERATLSRALRSYHDSQGDSREIAAIAGAAGSTLVIDRDRARVKEALLVAHLAADEPPENVLIACRDYLDAHPSERGCRAVRRSDWLAAPLQEQEEGVRWSLECQPSVTCDGGTMSISRLPGDGALAVLRWTLRTARRSEPLSLRAAIARCQSYEPLRASTRQAIVVHADDPDVSVSLLRSELKRVLESPIVLNRRLRELVLEQVARDRTSMSEIAIRCGRTKHDGRGNTSGETSWLGRRIGVLTESGQRAPTPWIHSDVLALIARDGLGVSPREAEAD